MVLSTLELKKLRVVNYPSPILRQTARPINPEEIGSDLANLSERMIELMVKSAGIGLAANQVGLPVRLIVVSLTGKAEDAEVLVNPELTNLQGDVETEEGCLSVPGIRAKVRRANACTVNALDLEGNSFVMDTVELGAIVLQHEVDHLDGILFVDRLGTVARMACRRALKQLEDAYENER
jgi:peptide deformylase